MKTKQRFLLPLLMAIVMMAMSPMKMWADNVTITTLAGTSGIGDDEGYASLFDGYTGNKWCSKADNGCYVIFKISKGAKMQGYTLYDAEDTSDWEKRHWKNWTIYGANFESDDDATKDNATGWTVVDSRENSSFTNMPQSFTVSNASTYQYYKITITVDEYENWEEVYERVQQMAEMAITWAACQHTYNNYTNKCDKCGEITAHTHAFPETSDVAATCTEGSKSNCTRCGEQFNDGKTDALGHVYPETFTDGVKECTRCHQYIYQPATKVTAENYASLGFTADNYLAYVGYYAIALPVELVWFSNFVNTPATEGETTTYPNASANAVLTCDIDMSSICHAANTETAVLETSWKPIGKASPYLGTFDGNNHELKNIYINADYEDCGFIGKLGGESATEPAILKNLTISGSIKSSESAVGAFAGSTFNAEITNCKNKANVEGKYGVGGLVGFAKYGNDKSPSALSITQSSNSGSIKAESGNTGGLLGSNNAILTLKECANTGSVVGGGYWIGGLIGDTHQKTTLSTSYNTGSVTGNSYVGGLIGDANSGSETSTISNCYNTGTVTSTKEITLNSGNVYIGGIFGCVNNCAINNVYTAASVVFGEGPAVFYGAFAGYYDNCTFNNCFFDNQKANYGFMNFHGEITPNGNNGGKTTAAFASGEVCYLLNGSRSEGTAESPLVWYQFISEDATPTLDVNQSTIVKYDATDGYYNAPVTFASITLQDGEAYDAKFKRIATELTYKRNFANTTYNALYVPFAMQSADWSDKADVYRLLVVVEKDNNDDGNIDEWVLKVVKLKAGESTKANTPYVIKPKATGEMELTLSNVTLAAAQEKSYWCASLDNKFVFTGTYEEKAIAADSYFFMSTTGALQYGDSDKTLKPQRWYMGIYDKDTDDLVTPSTFNPSAAPAKAISIICDDEDEATGINETLRYENVNENVYNLSGQRLTTPQKGINIINGKKILVK